jgi:acyl carrier protein
MSGLDGKIRKFLQAEVKKIVDGQGISFEDVTDERSLLGMGIVDSLGFLDLIEVAENEFKVEVDFGEFDMSELVTINGLVRLFESTLKK